MTTVALIFMVSTYVIVTGVTIYFFVRVMKTPPKPEEDSYTDNDNVER